MKRSIIIIATALSSIAFVSCSEEKKLLRKASVAVDASDYDKAVNYYDRILLKDSNTFSGNAGKGVVLSEYMGRYDQAIPYLEKALKRSPEKNVTKIDQDLGKSYHFIGNYPRALYYYSKVMEKNNAESEDYDYYLSKRIADCRYALDHPEVQPVDQQSVTNVGSSINTQMPDYDPVFVNNKMIFTSKRQDTPKEPKNGLDGRYFESMYIADMSNNNFSMPRRYTFPDMGTDSKFKKGNESVLSASSDGKALYIFRNGQVYEADLADPNKVPKILPENINFTDFQSGAFISKDGKTILFSSDSPNGKGGTDIYRSVKDENGNWSAPQFLSYNINTSNNEDSPYLSEDGHTLYFCSNGHPGYGGYDIYKSEFLNGEWTKPVNLGQPINTPGDETHFSLLPGSSKGYYASNRQGGYGDMDIYEVTYVTEENPECEDFDTLFVINAEQRSDDSKIHILTAQVPANYKNKVKNIHWKVNGVALAENSERVEYVFENGETYRVYAKAVVYCDSCNTTISVCNEKDIIIGEVVSPLVSNDAVLDPKLVVDAKRALGNVLFGKLSDEQLTAMGWVITPAYFDYNGTVLRSETTEILDKNILILKNNRDLTVVINGYSDARGSADYNVRLSQRRANSVKQYFVENGISPYRLSVKGYGESKVNNGCTDDVTCEDSQHQQNRKVEFNVTNKERSITGTPR